MSKKLAFNPVSRQSLSHQIADQIRQSIGDGSLRADDRLPTEGELAERFGVSRPTVREALKRLAAQNLVHSKRGPTGGTFIVRPQVEDVSEQLTTLSTLLLGMDTFSIADIVSARSGLERLCCQLIVERSAPADLCDMQAALVLHSDPEISAEVFCDTDVAFHRSLASSTGNPLISLIMHMVIEALQPVSNMVTVRYRDRTTIVQEHQTILAALEQGDADRASEVLTTQALRLGEQMERARVERK